jgi:phosphonate ABC transporter permease subunit PhnE
MEDKKKNETSPGRHALNTFLKFLLVIIVILVAAYAVDVTQINLEEPQDPKRQEVTIRVLRALARPDIFVFDEESRITNITVRMPCPDDAKASQVTIEDRVVIMSPNCVNTTQEIVTLDGEGFRPRTGGIIRWYPPGVVETTRALSSFRTDANGNFSETFTFPDIRETEEVQRLEIDEKWRTGITGVSSTVKITFEKIIETIFLAFVATVVGTLLAVPVSFIAARNLMMTVGAPLAAVMSAVIAIPIGYIIGSRVTGLIINLGAQVQDQVAIGIGVAIIAIVLANLIVRFGPPIFTSESVSLRRQILSIIRLMLAMALVFFGIVVLASLGIELGDWLEDNLGPFGFVGKFLSISSEAIIVLSPLIVGIFLALVGATFGARYGQEAVLHLSLTQARLVSAVTTAIGLFIFIFGVGSVLVWLYQFDRAEIYTLYPAAIAGVIGLVLGYSIAPKHPIPIGFWLYTITRTLLNMTRSVEPLIYVIVFAVWVGIGPFAGVIALSIHTIAALGKLFSEQVEGIDEGPVEAITATGANSLQMIVFAVVPQIVPPYIAFTLYRWDINVRFSTVIGFAGGGGIGFVLFQTINLLQYRQAAVMMIAIALVVMTLDYISSKIRASIT